MPVGLLALIAWNTVPSPATCAHLLVERATTSPGRQGRSAASCRFPGRQTQGHPAKRRRSGGLFEPSQNHPVGAAASGSCDPVLRGARAGRNRLSRHASDSEKAINQREHRWTLGEGVVDRSCPTPSRVIGRRRFGGGRRRMVQTFAIPPHAPCPCHHARDRPGLGRTSPLRCGPCRIAREPSP